MHTPDPIFRSGKWSCALFTLAATVQLMAQQAPRTPDANEPVSMSPFNVSSTNDHGYGVSNTVGATRINVALKDVPQSITVINREFLKDMGGGASPSWRQD